MPRPLKRGILSASTIILSKNIDKYAFMSGSNFYETDVKSKILPILLVYYATRENMLTYSKRQLPQVHY